MRTRLPIERNTRFISLYLPRYPQRARSNQCKLLIQERPIETWAIDITLISLPGLTYLVIRHHYFRSPILSLGLFLGKLRIVLEGKLHVRVKSVSKLRKARQNENHGEIRGLLPCLAAELMRPARPDADWTARAPVQKRQTGTE